jgi:hypothetical protein
VSPWVRVLAAFAAIVLAAVVLKLLPPIVVLVVVFGAFWYAADRFRKAHRAGRASGAELLGLRRETGDPFGSLALPVELFSRVTDPSVDDLVWGTWRGLDVRVFGLSFDGPPPSNRPAERERFGVALTNLAEDVHATVIEPQLFVTRLVRPPALERVETGDPPFDEAWSLWSADAEAARSFADDDVRSWVRSLGDGWGVEANGRVALVYGPSPERPDVVGVLEILLAFVAQVTGVPPGASRSGVPADPDGV